VNHAGKLIAMNNQARLLKRSERERSQQQQMGDHQLVGGRSDAQPEEIRSLHDNIRRLLTDIEELCDLCCFLDDDRQRYRQDAAEWRKLHQQVATELTEKVSKISLLCMYLVSHVKMRYTLLVFGG